MMKSIISAAVISVGLFGFGYFKACVDKNTVNLVEVKGLSEKIVKADLGVMRITFTNSQHSNLEDLYKKRVSDKEKILSFLKKLGVTDDEIVGVSTDTYSYTETVNTRSGGDEKSENVSYYRADDVVNIKTKKLEKIAKIKEELVKLSSEGVLATCNYSYKLTNFVNIKMDMMQEASMNARKNAEVFIAPQGLQIKDVVYLRQGEVTIRAADESDAVGYVESRENTSIDKKLRLVVRAGFSKK